MDKLDLALLHIEAKRNSKVKEDTLDYYLHHCRIYSPDCPYLNDSTQVCSHIERELRYAVREAAWELSDLN